MRLRRAIPKPVRRLAKRVLGSGRAEEPWHRQAVGGLWEEMGELQFRLLQGVGLRPEHHLLDVGCGSLRGGVRFVEYLEPGHYVGVDADERLLEAGRRELGAAGLDGKGARLVSRSDFEFRDLGETFDFAIAQSLWSHLPFNSIARCLTGVSRVLKPGGIFVATFFPNPGPRLRTEPVEASTTDGTVLKTHVDRDPYFYDPAIFPWLCEGSDLTCEYRGDWGHPRGQHLLVFRRAS